MRQEILCRGKKNKINYDAKQGIVFIQSPVLQIKDFYGKYNRQKLKKTEYKK